MDKLMPCTPNSCPGGFSVLITQPLTSVSPWVPIIPHSFFSPLFSSPSILFPPLSQSVFPSFPPPSSSPCDGSFCFGFSTSKEQSWVPWVSVLRQAQPLHLLLPPQRPAPLGEGQGPRLLCGVCAHMCLPEWGRTSVQSLTADQLLTPKGGLVTSSSLCACKKTVITMPHIHMQLMFLNISGSLQNPVLLSLFPKA